MKITIDTIKKELVIGDTVSVSELIEVLKNYEDYTVVNKAVALNNTKIKPPFESDADIDKIKINDKFFNYRYNLIKSRYNN